MATFIKHTLLDNDLILHNSRVVFWEQQKILILSDMHFGKIAHFRKAGIALPNAVMKEDIQRLFDAIQFFKPNKIIIVGDLFHSVANNEHEFFKRWRNDFSQIEFILVKGNHDIVKRSWYEDANIEVVESILKINNFIFVHQLEDYIEEIKPHEYIFCGHIHPGILIKGLGKQSLTFPCFYFAKKHLVLPAFGKFTGTFLVQPNRQENVFALVNNTVIKVN